MPGSNDSCAVVRKALLEHHLEGRPGGPVPPRRAAHVANCPACARYEQGLRRVGMLFEPGPRYTPALRRRTLAALAEEAGGSDRALLPLLAAVAAVSVAATFLAPLWIATRLLAPFVGSLWASSALALALCTSSGLAASCAAVFLLVGRPGAGRVATFRMGGRS